MELGQLENIGGISLDSELPSVSDLFAGKSAWMESDSTNDSLLSTLSVGLSESELLSPKKPATKNYN